MKFKNLENYKIAIIATPDDSSDAYLLFECPLNDLGPTPMRLIKDAVAEGCFALDKREAERNEAN